MAAVMKMSMVVFSAVTTCGLAGGYQRFWRNVSPKPSLKNTRCHNREHNRRLHLRWNLISSYETD